VVPCLLAGLAVARLGPTARGCSGVAHCEQNFAVGGLTLPQVGQGLATGLPHSMQNLASARLAVPQFQQIMAFVDGASCEHPSIRLVFRA
jgi:hypothetical protein